MMTRTRWARTLVGATVTAVMVAGCSGAAVNEDDATAPSPAAAAGTSSESAPAGTGSESAPAGTGSESAPAGTGSESAPAGDGSTVTVGLINPLTGPFAALGEDVNEGFQAYLDTHDGELSGHPIEVLSEDTANDAAIAQEGVVKLVDEGAVFLAGFVNSGVTYGVATTLRESGVPLMITTAGADGLTQVDAADNIFRLSYTSSQDSMPLGDYACNELGYETAAIVGLDYAFGWEAASGFAKVFEDAGCDVVQEIYVPLGTADWAPFVQQIDTDVDVVWTVIAGADGIRFLRTYQDFGGELPVIGHGSTTDEQILGEEAATAEGVVTTLHYSAMIDNPENAEHIEAFEAATGNSVSQYSEHGWATAQVLEAALTTIDGEVTPDALIDAIGAVEVDAPRGPLAFDEYGQAVYTVYVREVQEVDGEWVNAIIDEYPDVSQFWTYDPSEFLEGTPLADLKNTWE